MPGILVAGIGNIFLGDDGFGSEVVRRLPDLGPGVRVVDYGIRGMHLAYDLLDGVDELILVDAIPSRGTPGKVHVLEAAAGDGAALDAHAMDPATVFATLKALGGELPRTIVVGCEAENTDEGMGLSPTVSAAVDRAKTIVAQLARAG
ncbi:MAG: hydrogenase maturation protease [Nocardiaceae bacterium]|nr:hydrogenase maturation protease [Nocardiaceae bacterium]